MRVVNVLKEVNETGGLYLYKQIGILNAHVLSAVQVQQRTLDFHVHEDSDELFYVIEGHFYLESEEDRYFVKQGEFIIVPKGVRHRPVVETLTKFLMIELAGTLNKENSGELYSD